MDQNPTMEEILQTIRGFIAGQMEEGGSFAEGEVLELTDMLSEDGSVVNLKRTDDVLSEIDQLLDTPPVPEAEITPAPSADPFEMALFAPPAQEAPAPAAIPMPVPAAEPLAPASGTEDNSEASSTQKSHRLMSEESANASTESLRTLLRSVSKTQAGGFGFRSGTTMEELVAEMLKPQVAAWLDQHLPALVKQIVEREVQKLIPKDDE